MFADSPSVNDDEFGTKLPPKLVLPVTMFKAVLSAVPVIETKLPET